MVLANVCYGLISHKVLQIIPAIVSLDFSQIDNINTEFNKNDIRRNNDEITLSLNDLDIQKNDKIEICDINISDKGITSNIRTVDILDTYIYLIDNEFFSFNTDIN